MATIWWEQAVAVPAAVAWAALRRVDRAQVLFSPVLVDGCMHGEVRELVFANGLQVKERIVSVDEQRRRVAYSAQGAPFEHHSASMQVVEDARGGCRLIWVSDFLPDTLEEAVRPLVIEGAAAFAANLEAGHSLD